MLTFLADFSQTFGVLNVFRYITFRTGGATVTALLLVFLFGPAIINALRLKQGKGQPIRLDGPESHLLTKKGTPTMGGLMILFGAIVSILLWANPKSPFVWIVLMVTLGFGAIGFYDDYLKVTRQTHDGFSGRARLALEGVIAAIACAAMTYFGPANITGLALPLVNGFVLDMGLFFILFGAFVIIGAGLGFLWFNAPPASIFMGDTGSLALGGMLGTIAVATKHEIVLAIVGGLFVLEAMSVILQVGYFKMTGKRIFLMAPFHHHLEKMGWQEPQIVIRMWIFSFVLAMVGLATLKVR